MQEVGNFSDLPPPLPVERAVERFPLQDLWEFDKASRLKVKPDRQAFWRRAFLFLGAAGLTAYLTRELWLVLEVGGWAELEMALVPLFVLNIAWLSLSFM